MHLSVIKPSRRLISVNFEGLVQLGSHRPVYPKFKHDNQRIQLYIVPGLQLSSLCSSRR
jgi:hypothetical protein